MILNHSTKLLINIIALYIKIVIKAIVMLIATRIALDRLGVSDFGLYNLIAGVIVVLSFLNGSLMISTQRFLSIAIGEQNTHKISSIFNVSLLIHIVIALVVALLFIVSEHFLFNGFLKIDDESKSVAIAVYNIMVISSVITFATIPYSAVINAREDMWFFAISEILVTLMQLLAALILLFISANLLITYTWIMLMAVIIGFISKYIWCRIKYEEVAVSFKKMTNKALTKEMLGFVGWNTLGSSAVIVRNQGVAIVLNYFFGTVANAAYGIANQINSLVLTFSATLTTVFTPSIIQNRGAGNDERMLFIALLSSKASFLLSSIMAIPIIANLHIILKLWLNDIPSNTEIFTICIIIAFLFTQLYPGINRAVYATGKIRGYQIWISVCLMATIPLGVIGYKLGLPVQTILWVLVCTQFLCFLGTIYFAKKLLGLDFWKYIIYNFSPSIFLCSFFLGIGLCINCYTQNNNLAFSFWSSLILVSSFSFLFYKYIFNKDEKRMMADMVKGVISRFISHK